MVTGDSDQLLAFTSYSTYYCSSGSNLSNRILSDRLDMVLDYNSSPITKLLSKTAVK